MQLSAVNRLGAFLIHLAASLAIFAVLAAVVVYVWYPDFFFTTDGGWQGIRIIVLVDVVAGPLLTLVVYDRRKPELKRDLAIIVVFQAVCLIGGTWVVYSERPLALVYVDGHFFSMSADDYRDRGLAVPDLSHLPGPYPKRVMVDMPADFAEQSEIRRRAIQERKPLRALVDRYEPLAFDRMRVEDEAVDVAALQERGIAAEKLDEWLDTHGGRLQDYAFLPFGARFGYAFLGVSKADQEIVGLLDVPRLGPDPGASQADAD
ncbi:MAG: hypothetical protein U5Q16_12675 [Gammaproteobacteria bacterium]|nr:hypothetical protein [Gammaproteobacteria bacterium]